MRRTTTAAVRLGLVGAEEALRRLAGAFPEQARGLSERDLWA